MLRLASFPPELRETREWFALHENEWGHGEAYRFAVDTEGRMIGVVDIDSVDGRTGELGYWLERAAWGKGYAIEAARAVVCFAFDELGLSLLKSSHASDNTASGRILARLGFSATGAVERFSRSRREFVVQRCYHLRAGSFLGDSKR